MDKVIDLLCADTADLRELAIMAGANPKTFYHGINPGDLDLTGQDLEGIEFTNVTSKRIDKIRKAKAKEERLAMLLDSIIQNRSNGVKIIDGYESDKSKYGNAALQELRNAVIREAASEKIDNIALVRALRRPLAHQLADSRANLIYYLAKHLAKYPDIKSYLRKSWARSSSPEYDRFRSQIDKFLT